LNVGRWTFRRAPPPRARRSHLPGRFRRTRAVLPALLQNNNYWGDGKAEFSIYGAEIVRYGQPRQTEVIHILVREPIDPRQLVKPEGPPRADSFPF
jgi:hypothetical protein